MSNVYVLIGPTASGKTTILKNLENEVKKIVTCTTRPKREGEVNGIDYIYYTDAQFEKHRDDGFFLETTEYNTVHGLWKYGSPKKAYTNGDEDRIVVLNYEGAKQLRELYNESPEEYARPVLIFLNASIEECKRRALKRGDDPFEVERRVKEDQYIAEKTDILSIVNYTLDADQSTHALTNLIRYIILSEQMTDDILSEAETQE